MGKRRFLLPLLTIFTATCSLATAVGTLSWFVAKTKVDSNDKLGGAFLSQYFHCGTGTEADPFVITKPFHYENMIKFHYEYKSFAEAGYYFQFGSMDERMPGNPTSPVFYATDTDGNVDSSQTSQYLDLGNELLPPIGTEDYPFVGHLNGNDLCVRNFTIAGKGYYDIGIFGFVNNQETGEEGAIHNCYWRDFKIDTENSSNLVNKHNITSNPERAHYNSDTSTAVGYLAGHTVYAGTFTHCYLNNCDIVSNGTNAPSNTTYGYFGKVENDYLGGSASKGDNYSFELDSEAIYRSTRQIYDSISGNPIRTRSGYTEYSTPINGDTNEITTIGGVTSAKYPLSSAISRTKAADNNDTYTLEGKTVNNTSADRNYSFSTIGYQPTTTNVEPKEYEAFYYDGSNNKISLPSSTILKNEWNGSVRNFTSKNSSSIATDNGDFLYHNGTNWEYVHGNNSTSEGKGKKNFTINLSVVSSFDIDGGLRIFRTASVQEATAYLYIDGVQISKQDIKSGIEIHRSNGNTTQNYTGLKLNTTSLSCSLTRGTHYYSFFILIRTNRAYGEYTWLRDANTGVSVTGGGRATITAGQFTITQENYDELEPISFNCDNVDNVWNTSVSGNSYELYSLDTRSQDTSTIPTYVNSQTFVKPVYGIDVASLYDEDDENISISQLTDDTLQWRKDTGTTQNNDGSTSSWHKWIAYNTPSMTIDTSKSPVYLSDNPDITPRISDNGYIKGYEWENIDIVGGGVTFYYRNLGNLRQIKIITLPAENESSYVCNAVSTADINNGATFYATKYCPGSIVMYFKNSANAADDADRELGQIDFTYVNASALGMSWLNISTPAFKKGSGSFKELSDFGDITGDGLVSYKTTFSGTITESGAKQCSYCALDKDRKILGVFDTNGNPSTGFLNSDGTPNVSKLLQIDTYVVVLGSNSNIVNSSWITDISFEYISKEGYGGSFGTVEYRDLGGSVEATIFNFFVNNPENNKVYINVIFRPDEFTPDGSTITYPANSYYITVKSNAEVKVNIFLYDSNYHCVFNGTQYDSSKSDLESAPFS